MAFSSHEAKSCLLSDTVRYRCTRRDCAGLRVGKQHHCRCFKMSFNCRELLLAFARTARRVRHILTPGTVPSVGGHRTGALLKARTTPYSSQRHKSTVLWTVRLQILRALCWMSANLRKSEDKKYGRDLLLHLPVEEGYLHVTRKQAKTQPMMTESYGSSNGH